MFLQERLKIACPSFFTGPGNARGLLTKPIAGLGVLPIQKGRGVEQEAQPRPSGHRRVRSPAEETGTLGGRDHPVHRWPSPPGRLETCAQGSRWETDWLFIQSDKIRRQMYIGIRALSVGPIWMKWSHCQKMWGALSELITLLNADYLFLSWRFTFESKVRWFFLVLFGVKAPCYMVSSCGVGVYLQAVWWRRAVWAAETSPWTSATPYVPPWRAKGKKHCLSSKHALTNTQDLCPDASGLTSVRCLTDGVCFWCTVLLTQMLLMPTFPWTNCQGGGYSVSTTPWFIFSEPFFSPTSDGKHDLDALCRATVD